MSQELNQKAASFEAALLTTASLCHIGSETYFCASEFGRPIILIPSS